MTASIDLRVKIMVSPRSDFPADDFAGLGLTVLT